MTELNAATRLTANLDTQAVADAFLSYFGKGKAEIAHIRQDKVTIIIKGEISMEMLTHVAQKGGAHPPQIHIIPSGIPHAIAFEVRLRT